MKNVLFIRHGYYDEGRSGSLTEKGRERIIKVSSLLDQFFEQAYGYRNRPKLLTFSFSWLPRALETALILRRDADTVVSDLSLSERYEIVEPEKLLADIILRMEHWNALIGIVVAHGDMPAVLAETACKELGIQIVGGLPSPSKGEGYLVDFRGKQVFRVSPAEISLFDGSHKQVMQDEVQVTKELLSGKGSNNDLQKVKSQRTSPDTGGYPSSDNFFDDDIPF